MLDFTNPIGKPSSSPACRARRPGSSSSRLPVCATYTPPVLSAALNPGAPVGVSIQFRSVALAGADRIADRARIAVRMFVVVGACCQQVFEDIQLFGRRSLHALINRMEISTWSAPIQGARRTR